LRDDNIVDWLVALAEAREADFDDHFCLIFEDGLRELGGKIDRRMWRPRLCGSENGDAGGGSQAWNLERSELFLPSEVICDFSISGRHVHFVSLEQEANNTVVCSNKAFL
jgi:hypothetical protein